MAVIEAIATVYCEAAVASVTFSTLGSYEHLQLRINAKTDSSGDYLALHLTLNGDTGTNYSNHRIEGYGTSTAASAATGSTSSYSFFSDSGGTGSAEYGGVIINIYDYLNANKNTAIAGIASASIGGDSPRVSFGSSTWDNTAAVTSVTLNPSGANFVRGSELTLFGLASS
jgi:hypothetical protein